MRGMRTRLRCPAWHAVRSTCACGSAPTGGRARVVCAERWRGPCMPASSPPSLGAAFWFTGLYNLRQHKTRQRRCSRPGKRYAYQPRTPYQDTLRRSPEKPQGGAPHRMTSPDKQATSLCVLYKGESDGALRLVNFFFTSHSFAFARFHSEMAYLHAHGLS